MAAMFSPYRAPFYSSSFMHQPPNAPRIIAPGSVCTFCRNSGEPPFVFLTHNVRDPFTGEVTCQKLRSIRCLRCKQLGHTTSYCTRHVLPQQTTTETSRHQSGARRQVIEAPFTSQQSFCTFCKNAGEDYQVYTSHNLRNKLQKTTCPKLLATVCRTCGELGHTEGYCTRPVQEEAQSPPSLGPALDELIKLEDEAEYQRKAFEWASEKFGINWAEERAEEEERTSAEPSAGETAEGYCTRPVQEEKKMTQEHEKDVWSSAFTLAYDMPKRQPVTYDDFVTDVALVDAEEPAESQSGERSPNGVYTWPCVGGCGNMTNGSQLCCRTYCPNAWSLDEEDTESSSFESTNSETNSQWTGKTEQRKLCEYSDSPTDDDEYLCKDENVHKHLEYIIPYVDVSPAIIPPVLSSCTILGPVESLQCSELCGPSYTKSPTCTALNMENNDFDEKYTDVYDELYGEDANNEVTSRDEEEGLTDEENTQYDGWGYDTSDPWRPSPEPETDDEDHPWGPSPEPETDDEEDYDW